MTTPATEQEQTPKKDTPAELPPTPALPTGDTPITPLALTLPGLGSGPAPGEDSDVDDDDPNEKFYDAREWPEPTTPSSGHGSPPGSLGLTEWKRTDTRERKSTDSREKKSTRSGRLLTTLAEPMVFQSVDIDLQRQIVAGLEAAIPQVERINAPHRAEVDADIAKLKTLKSKLGDAEYQRRLKLLQDQRPPELASNVLYVGSIVIDEVPASSVGDLEMMTQARLVETDNSLEPRDNAHGLPAMAGVERLVVMNTIATMIKAKQFEYLRTSGVVGPGWRVIVEIHYYRDRSTAGPNLHKDTLGDTMFVNLNYTNETPMPGPEWVLNPPLVDTHEQRLAQTLPQQFRDDLEETRALPTPTTIETAPLPAHGVVAFVDEAIHHATPLVGHRGLPPGRLREFLKADRDFKDLFDEAFKAFTASVKKSTGTSAPWWSSSEVLTKLPDTDKNRWGALLALCDSSPGGGVPRPVLLKAGMTMEQIDRALLSADLASFTSVQIPGRARTDPQNLGRIPIVGDDGQPLPLQRKMSGLAMADQLPPKLPAKTPRRFFRTWVRAVPTGPVLERKATDGKPTESKRSQPAPSTPVSTSGGSQPGSQPVVPKLATEADPKRT